MYKSKQQVDNHVSALLSRIRDEKERSSRGFVIAKLYRGVKEYDIAKKYLALFLSVEDSYAPAHRLMGELLEATSSRPGHAASATDLEKAINYYKRSYELDGQQKDLIKKICSLYARGDFDKQQFQFWVDKADVFFPRDSVVFSFKEKLMGCSGGPSGSISSPASTGSAPSQLERLLVNELSERPDDVQLSYRLLQLYERSQQHDPAYNHVLMVLQQGSLDLLQYRTHYDWHLCATQHLEAYCSQEGSSVAAWKVYFTVLLSLIELALRNRTVVESASAIRRLDSALAHSAFGRLLTIAPLLDAVKLELEGQLHYHMALLALKKGDLRQQQHAAAAGALLLASSLVTELKPEGLALAIGSTSGKLKQSAEQVCDDIATQYLANQSHYRRIQTACLLVQWLREPEKRHQLNTVRQQYSHALAKKELLSTLLGDVPPRVQGRSAPAAVLSSFFVASSLLESASVHSLSDDSLSAMEDELYTMLDSPRTAEAVGGSLHDLIWLALQEYGAAAGAQPADSDVQPAYAFLSPVLAGLQQGTLSSCFDSAEPESLCRLDAEVFFYAAVRTAALKARELEPAGSGGGSSSRLRMGEAEQRECGGRGLEPWQLPAVLAPDLCTQDQADWWCAVHTFCSAPRGSSSNRAHRGSALRFDVPRLRRVVQRGIETVRLAVSGSVNVQLMIHIAQCLEQRLVEAKADEPCLPYEDRVPHLRAWADRYWESALDVLGRLKRNLVVRVVKDALFVQHSEQLTSKQVDTLHDEVRSCMMAAAASAEDSEHVLTPGNGGSGGADDNINGDELDAQHASFSTAVSQQLGDESFSRTPITTRGTPLRGRAMNSTLISTSSSERRPAWSSSRVLHTLESRVQTLGSAVDTRLKALEDEQRCLANSSGELLTGVRSLCEGQQALAARSVDLLTELRIVRDDVRTLRDEQRSLVAKSSDTCSELRWLKEEQRSLASRSSDVIDHVRTVKEDQRALMMKNSELAGELRSLKSLMEGVTSDLRRLATLAPGGYGTPPQQLGGSLPLPLGAPMPSSGVLHPGAIQPGAQQQPPPFFSPAAFSLAQPPVIPPYMQLGTYPHIESSIGKMKASGGRGGFVPERSGARGGEHEEEASGEDYNEDECYGGGNDDGGGEWEDDQGCAASEQNYLNDTTDDGEYGMQQCGPEESDDKLVQQWPYGADAGVEGRHTVSYKPKTIAATAEMPAIVRLPSTPGVSRAMPPPGYLAPPSTIDKSSSSDTAMPPNVVLGKHLQSSESPAALLKNPVPAPPLVVQVPRHSGGPVVSSSISTPPAGGVTRLPGSSIGNPISAAGPQIVAPVTSASTAPSAATLLFSTLKVSPGAATISTRSRVDSGQADADDEDGDAANVSGSHDPYYAPIIDLPPEVDVVTGEEDESVAFEARAKLFRLAAGSEWKERGTGQIKLLVSAVSADGIQKARIVMRRDQTLKVCANHFVVPGMELKPLGNSDTSWVWKAIDFTEGKNEETFAVRFKNSELASDFRKAFLESQQISAGSKSSTTSGRADDKARPLAKSQPASAEGKPASLSEQFKPAAGSWECTGCLLRNAPAALRCLACSASKPGSTAAASSSSTPAAAAAAGQTSAVNSPLASLLSASSNAPKVGSGSQPMPAAARSLVSAATVPSNQAPSSSASIGAASSAGDTRAPATFSFAGWATGLTAGSAAQKPLFGVAPAAVGSGSVVAASGLAAPGSPLVAVTTASAALKPVVISSPATGEGVQQKPLFGGWQTPGGAAGALPLFGAQKALLGAAPVPSTVARAAAATAALPPLFGTLSSATAGQKSLFGTPVSSALPAATTAVASTSSAAPAASGPSSSVAGIGSKQSGASAPGSVTQAPSLTVTPKPPSASGAASGSIIGQLLTQPPADSSKPGSESNPAKPSIFQGFTFNLPNQISPFPQTQQPFASGSIPFSFGGSFSMKPAADSVELQQPLLPPVGSTSSDPSQQQQRPRAISEGEKSDGNVSVEEYEPQVEFKPVIPLPDLVEVKTGEEDEEALFADRARLYRFDKATNQWKERGTGVLKVLRSVDKQQYRLVMRRDQVLKLCANHLLAVDTELKPMQGNAKAWCWFASDFSEGSVSTEQLAARFSSQETAELFREVVADCREKLKGDTTHKPDTAPPSGDGIDQRPPTAAASKSTTATGKPAAAAQPSLAELLKPPEGTWSCETCLASNSGKTQRCPCCQTLKPGATKPEQPGQGQSLSSLPAPTGIRFGGQAAAVSGQSAAPLFGSQSAAAPLFGGQSAAAPLFGGQSAAAPLFGGQSAAAPLFGGQSAPRFGGQSVATSLFGARSAAVSESSGIQSASAPSKDFIFGGSRDTGSASTGGFTFGLARSLSPGEGTGSASGAKGTYPSGAQQQALASPVTGYLPASADAEPTSPDLYVNESGEDDHISFAPVVQLPEHVEVETGEENEDPLYVHRAKLFRFSNGEWKERGIGDVKLLKHRQSKRIRIVMRRDQILKLCLNHYIGPSLELTPMSGSEGKAFIWSAMDFAEGEGCVQQFALRFKDADAAAAFKQAFEDAKQARHSELSPVGTSTPNARRVPEAATSGPAMDSATTTPMSSSCISTPASIKAAAAAVFGSPRLQSPNSSVFGKAASSSSSPLACLPNRRIADGQDEGEVIFTSEEKPSADQLQRARMWQLPDAFYLYENHMPCTGCIGCEDREEAYLDRLFRGVRKSDAVNVLQAASVVDTGKASSTSQQTSSGPEARLTNERVKADSSTPESGGGDDLSNTMFSNQASSLSFSALASAAAAGGASFGGTSSGFAGLGRGKLWSGAGSSLFSSQNKPASKGNDVSSAKDDEDEEGDDNPECGADDIHFKPVLEKLPDLIEVKTGEESEIVEFCQRCKLYRFDGPSGQSTSTSGSQWKERGVGEIKLLRDPSTGAVRVVMRRDQVLKLACNHRLTADIELCPLATSEQAWCWQAMDYSENTLKSERFAARFKTIALANEFKQAVERCKATLGIVSSEARPASDSAKEQPTVCQASAAELQALVSGSCDLPHPSAADESVSTNVVFEKRCTATEHEDGKQEILGMGTITILRNATDDQHFSVTMVNGDSQFLFRGIVPCGCSLERGPKKTSRYIMVSSRLDEKASSATVSRKIQLDFSSAAAADELDATFKSHGPR